MLTMEEKDLLQKLHADIQVIKTQMNVLSDHEKRIRFLERYAFILVGAAGLISFLVNYLK
jgi:hypothetical protein